VPRRAELKDASSNCVIMQCTDMLCCRLHVQVCGAACTDLYCNVQIGWEELWRTQQATRRSKAPTCITSGPFVNPDTDILLSKAAELQNIMTDHTTYFYPYDNLATDPNPGDIHHSSMSLLTGFAVLSILHLQHSALQPEEAIILIILIAKSCRHFLGSFRGSA